MAAPVPTRDLDLEAVLGEAERELAHALAELGTLRTASQAHGEELAALRRAAATRQAEIDTARRRLADIERRATEETEQADVAAERRATLEAGLAAARSSLADAIDAERAAAARREQARERADRADAERAAAHQRAVTASASAATLRARLDGLEARLAEEETRGIARAARKAGGRRLDEDLSIDPALRAAAEAALAEATRAYVVTGDAVATLASERGSIVVSERTSGPVAPDDARERRFRDALAAAGGGILDGAVQRDVTGAARRLLARAAWLPDLASCLAIQPALPPGWIVVTRDGSAIIGQFGVTFGAAESVLERRAEATRLVGEYETHETDAAAARGIAVGLAAAAKEAADAVEIARADESRAAGARRAAEEAERLVARQHETAIREHAWHEAQTERLRADLDRARIAAAAPQEPTADDNADNRPEIDGAALAAWETRAAELRARRDRLAEEFASLDATDAMPRTDGRGPRRQRSSPRSGWHAPTARSWRSASVNGPAPQSAMPSAPRWPRPLRPRPAPAWR